jgi:hypothetical protein
MKSALTLLVASLALVAFGQDEFRFKKGVVIPVRMDDEISLKGSRVGDRFRATVSSDGQDLPPGTRLVGYVKQMGEQNGKPYVELAFNEAQLPAGRRLQIEAVPIKWDERSLNREKDGRFTTKKGFGKKDDAVVAGVIGGLVVGALLKKPFEGAFVGAIAGIIVAEAGANASNNLILAAGTPMGALFTKSVDSRSNSPFKDDDQLDERPSRGWPGRDPSVIGVIRNDGKELRIGDAEKPYVSEGEWMVPLWAVAEQIKIDVDQSSQAYYLSSNVGTLRIEQDSSDYRLNGKSGSFKVRVTKKDRIVYVPLEVFRLLGRDRIQID